MRCKVQAKIRCTCLACGHASNHTCKCTADQILSVAKVETNLAKSAFSSTTLESPKVLSKAFHADTLQQQEGQLTVQGKKVNFHDRFFDLSLVSSAVIWSFGGFPYSPFQSSSKASRNSQWLGKQTHTEAGNAGNFCKLRTRVSTHDLLDCCATEPWHTSAGQVLLHPTWHSIAAERSCQGSEKSDTRADSLSRSIRCFGLQRALQVSFAIRTGKISAWAMTCFFPDLLHIATNSSGIVSPK